MDSAADPAHRSASSASLLAAYLAGAGAIGLLGQLAIDRPFALPGPWGALSLTFEPYAAIVTSVVAVGCVATLTRRPWAIAAAATLAGLNIALFLQTLFAHPLVGGSVVMWQVYLLGRFMFPGHHRPPWGRHSLAVQEEVDEVTAWLADAGPALRHVIIVAVLATVVVVGYQVGQRAAAVQLCLLLDGAALAVSVPLLLRLLRAGSRAPLVIMGLCVLAAALSPWTEIALLGLAGALLATAVTAAARTSIAAELLEAFFERPALLVLISFVVLIALGTLLLSFPASAARPDAVSGIDALFTATSASCVTGLIVLDTPGDFSPFGQVVILLLIQIGGLNIMVLSTFAAILLGRGLGLKGEKALREVLDLQTVDTANRLVVFIVATTLVVESVGAALLGLAYLRRGVDAAQAAWFGVFHAVSAFCNAGFALHSDSLATFTGEPFPLLVLAGLITLGGIGFAVLAFAWLRARGRRHLGLAVQAKIVLAASSTLVVLGTLMLALGEWDRALAGLEVGDKIVNALFMSVTLRTAGFNSVPLAVLHPATVLMMMVLMFIGASPGGTGGGIKTTTFVVLLSAIPSIARGRPRLALFRRAIPLETVYRSAAIAVVSLLVILASTLLLLATQIGEFEVLLFEVISAFNTVGLSLGGTATLDELGKVVVVVTMLLGRIGPLSLALLLGRSVGSRVDHPEAKIMVG